MPDFNMGTARGRIVIEYNEDGTRRFNQDMERTERRAGSAQGVFKGMASGMGKAGLGIAAGFGLAVKAAADFDKQLSAIKAVTGATTNDMEQVRKKALQLGADTQFSAGEAANAIEELAKAGIPLPDILNGAADAAVALAAAGGVDLKTAAELAANAMNQFGLAAKDLPGVADLIAGAANASAIDVGEFGQSLKQVGAVANLAGISFKDTAVAIALMGNAGIKGSDAGTSLKTMLQNLNPQSAKQLKLMKQLGIVTKDGSNQFFDATGNAKSLAAISDVLNTALKHMTREQKLAALGTLFGSDAIRGAAILSDQGAAGFNKMADAMGKVKAADVAKTRMDNLSGSIEQMKGSLETALISLGSGSQGPLKSFVDALTGMINAFNKLSDGQKQTIVAVLLSVGAFLLLGSAIIKTVFFFQRLANAIRILRGLSLVQSLLIQLRILALAAGGAVKSLALALGRGAAAAGKAAARGIASAAQATARLAVSAARAGAALIAQAARGAASAAVSLARMAASAALAAGRLALVAARSAALAAASFASTLRAGAAALASMAVSAARAAAAQAVMLARTIATNIALAAARLATLAWAAAMLILQAATGPIGLIVIAVIALVAAIILAWKNSETFQRIVIGVFNAVKGAITGAISFIVSFVRDHWQLLLAIMLGPPGIILGLIIKNFTAIKNFITGIIGTIVNFIRNHWQLIIAIILGPLGIILGLVISHWNKIWGAIRSAAGSITRTIIGFKNGVITHIRNIVAVVGIIAGIFNRFNSAVFSRVGSVLRYLRGVPGQIIRFFGGAGSWLWNAGWNIINGLYNGIASGIGRIRSLLSSVTSWIPSWKGPERTDKKLLTANGQLIMESLVTGFMSRLPLIKASLGGITQEVSASVNNTAFAQVPASAGVIPPSPSAPLSVDDMKRAFIEALAAAGVGKVYLDGRVISDVVSKNTGRAAAQRRRTG